MPNPEQIQYTPRSSRVQELLSYVSQEIERFRAGEISTLSTREELRERFGFVATGQVDTHLRKTGLVVERRNLMHEEPVVRESELITPSSEWAWMMGAIAGRGHIARNGNIIFGNPNPELREAIKSHGERLFNTNSRMMTSEDPKRSPKILFYNKKIAFELGNFTKDQYVETIPERHGWIMQNDQYIWSFLKGMFETRGAWKRNTGNKFMDIQIHAGRRKEVNFLADLLVRVGIKNPRVQPSNQNREGVSGLHISSLEDIKLFSENVQSVIPKKEEQLTLYREIDPRVQKSRIYYTREEIIREWAWMTAILGKSPTLPQIEHLKKLGIAKCSPRVYIRAFGTGEGGKYFRNARTSLEDLIENRRDSFSFDPDDIRQARKRYEFGKEQERKPRGMPQRFSDDEILQEWIKARSILGYVPNTKDLKRLREEGLVQLYFTTFKSRFGDGRSFSSARDALEKLVFSKSVNNSLQQFEYTSGKQIRFEPKAHLSSEEEAKKRVDQITGYTEQTSIPQVLYGHDGESIIFPPAKIEDTTITQRYTVDPVTKLIVLKEPEKEKPTSQETQIFPKEE